ncbi:MAG TPA: branched-chain amino acid aminotransferase [Syntrophales bacterium]|nr:branched-chain amino acid aminotransferase [Syntrophales bacterium]
MEIKIVKAKPKKLKPKPADESKLGFGKIFTDHFFTMKYHADRGWYDAMIEPYRLISLDPTAMCLHYAQEIFEGLKAYRGKDDQIYLFRPYKNIDRMNASAERLCMPKLDPELFMTAMKKLILLEKDWIPRTRGASLYIRPTMVATEAALGVHDANEYLFFIVVGPVGVYYSQGFSPTSMYVTDEYVRAVRGGIGNIKAAANYAASLMASKIAMEKGFTQVLWLDAIEKKYIEEVGTSNVFFLIGDELITPPLGGSILPGVTRDSVIHIAKAWNIHVSERPISINEVVDASASGKLKEAFASGTAAIVSPIGMISYKGKAITIADGKTGSLTEKLYNEILQIQYGEKDDPFGWRMLVSE